MAHDASKVVLGATKSTFRVVTNIPGATRAAGLLVRRKNDGTSSLAKTDGEAVGISVGRNLSGLTNQTYVCRAGLGVPVQLASGFTPVIGAQVHMSDTTGQAGTAGTGYTGINAVYASGKLTGISEVDGSAVDVALIDMVGGV